MPRTSVDTIWAAMEVNGAMRSDDGGETWTDLSDPLVELSRQPHLSSAILTKDTAEGMLDVHALCVARSAPDAPVLALRMGLFRAERRGEAWADLGIGKHAAHLRYGRDAVAAPWDDRTLFACVADSSRGDEGRLYKSADAGGAWTPFDLGAPVPRLETTRDQPEHGRNDDGLVGVESQRHEGYSEQCEAEPDSHLGEGCDEDRSEERHHFDATHGRSMGPDTKPTMSARNGFDIL